MPAVTESSPASYRLLREVEAPTLEAVNQVMQKEGPLTDSETLRLRQLDQDTRRYLRECMASSTPVQFGEQALQVRSENTSKLSTLKEAVALHVQHKKQVRVNLPLENLKRHTLAELMDLAHFLKERQGILKNPEVVSVVLKAIRTRSYGYRELFDIVHIHAQYNEPMTLGLNAEAIKKLPEAKLVELHAFISERRQCLKNPEVIPMLAKHIQSLRPIAPKKETHVEWAAKQEREKQMQRDAEVAAIKEIRSKTGLRGFGNACKALVGRMLPWGKKPSHAENEWATASA